MPAPDAPPPAAHPAPADPRARVLLVDDHPIVRAGCLRLLDAYHVIEARTGDEALALYRAGRADMVVLDLGLPDIGGLDVARRLRSDDPTARILIFSMHDAPIFAARALELGAMGFITKNDAPDELAKAVAAVLRGDMYLGHAMARDLAVMNFTPDRGPLRHLTARELEILALLGRGRTLGDIADQLGISYKTVANGCTQIKDKLGAQNTRDLIRIAVEHRLSG